MPDWWVVNVAEAPALSHERGGEFVPFENPGQRFPQVGINIRVLAPGQPGATCHSENMQEDFLVLSGECLAILDNEERRLRAGDFVHCPAGTEHVLVGGGDRPCAVLMVGARGPEKALRYPVNELAARHGASVSTPTSVPAEAYADAGWLAEFRPTRLAWPPALRRAGPPGPASVRRPSPPVAPGDPRKDCRPGRTSRSRD